MICFKWALLEYLPNREQRVSLTPLYRARLPCTVESARLGRVGARARVTKTRRAHSRPGGRQLARSGSTGTRLNRRGVGRGIGTQTRRWPRPSVSICLSWLDGDGHAHTRALRITERYHRRDAEHMDYPMTIDDPKGSKKNATIRMDRDLMPDTEPIEWIYRERARCAA
jgi:hypothetical protein